ncbi:TRAP transporter small permease subunit [Proteobacteria bacterium 005FR1]|nr:TRAP transporter small permease subunit [Proteobacteria bacterium 005FR1]
MQSRTEAQHDAAAEPAPLHLLNHYLIRPIDLLSEWTGRVIAWLAVLMVAITGIVVVIRRGFGLNSIALQESVIYMHAALFLLGAAFAFKHEAHVRVDIFYRRFGPVARAWINSLGTLIFLFPLCGFMLLSSWGYVQTSWQIGEVSSEPGGLAAVFLLKTLIPIAAITLALQGLAELLRALLCLMTDGRLGAEKS